MKIPNYDTKNGQTKDRRVEDFLPEQFQILCAGKTGTGKTNTVLHLLLGPLIFYDKIYWYGSNNAQFKLQYLKKVMDEISKSKKVGYDVLEIGGQEDIKDTSEYPKNNRKIVIFDDLVNAPDKIQNKIANHFTNGRHSGISSISIVQSYSDTPQKLRLNCSHMILYPPTTRAHLRRIALENGFEPELFNKLGPYEFLFLDKEKKTVKTNFNGDI